jgi:hypothetical protein
MLDRCHNEQFNGYRYYGGKGIGVCERWFDFKNFLDDMGERPLGMTLDRLDSKSDYGPNNCKWSTSKEQNRHARRMAMFNGEPMSRKEIAAHLGITHQCLNKRMSSGRIILENL